MSCIACVCANLCACAALAMALWTDRLLKTNSESHHINWPGLQCNVCSGWGSPTADWFKRSLPEIHVQQKQTTHGYVSHGHGSNWLSIYPQELWFTATYPHVWKSMFLHVSVTNPNGIDRFSIRLTMPLDLDTSLSLPGMVPVSSSRSTAAEVSAKHSAFQCASRKQKTRCNRGPRITVIEQLHHS